MKLPRHAFVTYWEVHAWAGVLVSLVVNAIFFSGVFTLFRDETLVWQDPRAHSPSAGWRAPCDDAPLEPVARAALDAADVTPKYLALSRLDAGCAPVEVEVRGVDPGGEDRELTFLIDRRTAEILEPRSVVATFLFYFHFFYEAEVTNGVGMWIAGLFGVFMLLILASGVLLHLKDLTRQLHQFRPRLRPRVMWSDMHKVLGVMGLPFQTLMVLTGAIVCLAQPVLGLWSKVVFSDVRTARAAFFVDHGAPRRSSEEPADMWSIDALLARAERAAPGLDPRYIRIQHPGDAAASAKVAGRVPVLFGDATVTLSATDGALLGATLPDVNERAITTTQRWIYGFHFGWYGGLAVQLLYALLGLAGCATILSGNWIWLERRDPRRERRGNRILGRLTVGLGLGVAVAVAAMYFVSRAIPIDVAWHATAEVAAFVGSWLVATVAVFFARDERIGAAAVLAVAGALFVATPILGFARTPLHLVGAFAHGAWDVAIVDVVLLVSGALALVAAFALRRRGDRS